MRPSDRLTFWMVLGVAGLFVGSTLQAKDTLRIEKAFVGADDGWRDVTPFLQDQMDNDAVSVRITQPFAEIGGDPAPGRVKHLLVDYRLNGQPFRLCLEEQFPVAFAVQIPSPQAEAPGANPEVTAIMESISSAITRQTQHSFPSLWLLYITAGIAVAALICAGLALAQIRRIRRVLLKPPVTVP